MNDSVEFFLDIGAQLLWLRSQTLEGILELAKVILLESEIDGILTMTDTSLGPKHLENFFMLLVGSFLLP